MQIEKHVQILSHHLIEDNLFVLSTFHFPSKLRFLEIFLYTHTALNFLDSLRTHYYNIKDV